MNALDPDGLPLPLEYKWRADNGWVASGRSVEFPCLSVGAFTVFGSASDGDITCSESPDMEAPEDIVTSAALRCTEATGS